MLARHYNISISLNPSFAALQDQYRQLGYLSCNMSQDIAHRLEGIFDRALSCKLSIYEFEPGYYTPRHATPTIEKLNINNQYFLPPQGPAIAALQEYLLELRPVVEIVTGSPIEVVNVRAWSKLQGAKSFGPTAWHCDSVSRHVRKIMSYPRPPNAINGTLELIGRDGQQIRIDSSAPLAVLADVGGVIHRKHGVEPDIAACSAMVFCGFWNRAYGDVFSRNVVREAGGYHGPPRLPAETLAKILDNGTSPHFIAAMLRSEVQRREPDYVFNHQHARSREEFIDLAKTYGFTLVAADHSIASPFDHIPTITDMHSVSDHYHFNLS